MPACPVAEVEMQNFRKLDGQGKNSPVSHWYPPYPFHETDKKIFLNVHLLGFESTWPRRIHHLTILLGCWLFQTLSSSKVDCMLEKGALLSHIRRHEHYCPGKRSADRGANYSFGKEFDGNETNEKYSKALLFQKFGELYLHSAIWFHWCLWRNCMGIIACRRNKYETLESKVI